MTNEQAWEYGEILNCAIAEAINGAGGRFAHKRATVVLEPIGHAPEIVDVDDPHFLKRAGEESIFGALVRFQKRAGAVTRMEVIEPDQLPVDFHGNRRSLGRTVDTSAAPGHAAVVRAVQKFREEVGASAVTGELAVLMLRQQLMEQVFSIVTRIGSDRLEKICHAVRQLGDEPAANDLERLVSIDREAERLLKDL